MKLIEARERWFLGLAPIWLFLRQRRHCAQQQLLRPKAGPCDALWRRLQQKVDSLRCLLCYRTSALGSYKIELVGEALSAPRLQGLSRCCGIAAEQRCRSCSNASHLWKDVCTPQASQIMSLPWCTAMPWL